MCPTGPLTKGLWVAPAVRLRLGISASQFRNETPTGVYLFRPKARQREPAGSQRRGS
jgi:hypothetical protein